jgi:hypothetical protein
MEIHNMNCVECGIFFSIDLNVAMGWTKNRREFYCPNGHIQRFAEDTKDELENLRKEVKELNSKLEVQAKVIDDLKLELEIYKPVGIVSEFK